MTDLQPLPMGSRFMTGTPPNGMGFQFFIEPDNAISARLVLDQRHEGPPDHGHGGFSAALLDEVMGMAVWHAGFQVVAVNIQFNLKAPVPLYQEIYVRGWLERHEGRKIFTRSQIVLASGKIAVEGTGIFVEAPHLFSGEVYFLPPNAP